MSYELIDRFLRNNLGDDDYAEYSEALDSICPREWQGLTDDEREEICRSDPYRPTEMLKLAEAKLKEKNK